MAEHVYVIDQVPLDVEVLVLIKLLNAYHEHVRLVFVLAGLEQGVHVDFGLGLVAVVHL